MTSSSSSCTIAPKKGLLGGMSSIVRLALIAVAVFGITYAISWFTSRQKKPAAAAPAAAPAAAAPAPAAAAPAPPAAAPPPAATTSAASPVPAAPVVKAEEAYEDDDVVRGVVDIADVTDDDSSIATSAAAPATA